MNDIKVLGFLMLGISSVQFASAVEFSCMGAAYRSAKSGVDVASMGVMRLELVMESIVQVFMAGVLGICGLIITVITGMNPKSIAYYLFDGYAHLALGLACGLTGLSAGMAIGIIGDAGVSANAKQPTFFVRMILILIFAEALALYGLIFEMILSSRAGQSREWLESISVMQQQRKFVQIKE
ncbi:hypothetical protein KP509_03G024300 [Ceratopteris richardii]|uniref:V-type proton ATPase proteolipid subunit n=1 Tax=Ceratopteris richardii TaxID=49495 RepID=A0A8T2UXW8_CERRI|nr:hypothetical protein KP509_03G024300 [Ceratopteris richardii]